MGAEGARGEAGAAFERLRDLVATLRAPGGCPWDREQTLGSARRYLLEEAYETLEALEGGDPAAALEELGDLLFQIAFLAQLFGEQGAFDLADVAERVTAKMVARHPHVFAGQALASADAVRRAWPEVKAAARGEAPGARSLLDGVPRALPALEKALLYGERAAETGFDWPEAEAALGKVEEELGELRAALASAPPAGAARDGRAQVREEVGDALLALASVARLLGVNPEEALQQANAKFARRFRHVERELAAAGVAPREAGLERMEALWRQAKARGL